MQKDRQIIILRIVAIILAVNALIASTGWLLNLNVQNPTGRRYSSEVIDLENTNSSERGQQGEAILASDLGVPNNNRNSVCICDILPEGAVDTPPTGCNECRTRVDVTLITQNPTPYRVPDFITDDYIAEVKNSNGLPYSGRNVDEITDYVAAALELDIPLWIYVRIEMETEVDEQFRVLAESTGGGVVYYLRDADWVDTQGEMVERLLTLGIVLLGYTLVSPLVSGLFSSRPAPAPSPRGGPRNDTGTPEDLMKRARRKVDKADSEQEINTRE